MEERVLEELRRGPAFARVLARVMSFSETSRSGREGRVICALEDVAVAEKGEVKLRLVGEVRGSGEVVE